MRISTAALKTFTRLQLKCITIVQRYQPACKSRDSMVVIFKIALTKQIKEY